MGKHSQIEKFKMSPSVKPRVVGVNSTGVLNIVFVAMTGIQQAFSDLPWTHVAAFTV